MSAPEFRFRTDHNTLGNWYLSVDPQLALIASVSRCGCFNATQTSEPEQTNQEVSIANGER
jgi:hypothetical protein